MITTGVSNNSINPWGMLKTTEVGGFLDGESCSDVAEFPGYIFDGASVNFHGTPVVCGGCGEIFTTYSQNCYKFNNFGWQEFATMKDKRGHAAGVMYKDKFHVFGGGDLANGIVFQTSEIISICRCCQLDDSIEGLVHVKSPRKNSAFCKFMFYRTGQGHSSNSSYLDNPNKVFTIYCVS